MKRTRGEKIFNWINIALLVALAFLSLYPFIYVFSMSLSTAAEANRDGLHLYPRDISFDAYKAVFTNPAIWIGYVNAIFRTVVGTALTVVVTCLCAYPLSKKHLPGRRPILFAMLITMLFQGGLVPMYLLINGIGLIDSLWVYVLPVLTSAFNIILVKNFFEAIPESLEEAACIDGAGPWRTLFQIYVPLSKPILATVALWTAVMHWNMWFDALLYINDENKLVLQMFLRRIVVENSTQLIEQGLVNPDVTQFTAETIKAATVVVTILPMLALYPFVQRYFVKGIMVGGVKG